MICFTNDYQVKPVVISKGIQQGASTHPAFTLSSRSVKKYIAIHKRMII
jgi:hypothetical protein